GRVIDLTWVAGDRRGGYDTHVIPPTTPMSYPLRHPCRTPYDTSVTGGYDTHVIQRRIGNQEQEEQREIPHTPRPGVGSICVEGPDGEMHDVPAGVVNDPEAVRVLGERMANAFGSVYWQQQVETFAQVYDLAWVARVFEDALTWRSRPRSSKPLLNTLREWAQAGGPTTIEADRPAICAQADDVPLSASQR